MNKFKFATPEESPGYLLWRMSTIWRSSIEKVLKPFNLTHPQFVILATTAWLTRDNEEISQIDISNVAGLDPNTTSQILRGLETKSYIKRVRSVNERSKNPFLTDLGITIFDKALQAVENADEFFFKALTSSELAALRKVFCKLIT